MNKIILISLFFISLFSVEGIENIVIIGKGAAGSTAAIFAGQAGLSPYVVDGEKCSGQLAVAYQIENYPGFPEGIQGEELVERMQLQAERFGAHFHEHYVIHADLQCYPFQLTLENGEMVETYSVIIATGSIPRKLGIPNEEDWQGSGISTSAQCDLHHFKGKSIAVVGGGNSALEQALFLANSGCDVILIHRGKYLEATPYLVDRVCNHPKICIVLEAKVEEVAGIDWIENITYQDLITKNKMQIPCQGIIVAIGRSPNTHLFENQLVLNEKGHICIMHPLAMTNIPGVFAAGDIVEGAKGKVITAAASGAVAADEAIHFLKILFLKNQ